MHFEKIKLVQVQNGRQSAKMWQNVTFRERMPFKNFRLNRIQNGRLSATIYFHIADIW